MNVLIYAGPSIPSLSISTTTATLKCLLLPSYAVQTIAPTALLSQPWQDTCSLLVLPSVVPPPTQGDGNTPTATTVPGQADVFKVKEDIRSVVQTYLDNGGNLLAFGVGWTAFEPKSVLGLSGSFKGMNLGLDDDSSWEERNLRFYDRASGSEVKFGCSSSLETERNADASSRALWTSVGGGKTFNKVLRGRGAISLSPSSARNPGVSILGRYTGADGPIAGLVVPIGNGRAALWDARIECQQAPPTPEGTQDDSEHLSLLRDTLFSLSLRLPEHNQGKLRPTPQFLTSTPNKPKVVDAILGALALATTQKDITSGKDLTQLKDLNDTFHFHLTDSAKGVVERAKSDDGEASLTLPKDIVVYAEGKLPGKELAPLFDFELYYRALEEAREKDGVETEGEWGVGEAMMYGEIVTSTQTMLDKNPTLLTTLPTPLLSIASFQLAGRGRGSNVWLSLSPSGSLAFSLLLRIPYQKLGIPPYKVVFVQYLFGLAVTEACRDTNVLGSGGERVRLKWPNDIYAEGDGEGKQVKKLGGILVNSNFTSGSVDLVIGCGLNVSNPAPVLSLSNLASSEDDRKKLRLETIAAVIMTKFEPMWETFLRSGGSFEPFLSLYLERWLHSDQQVTLTTTMPHTKVRIVGITLDHGLLRTVPERGSVSGGFIDLQPDGNSFDIMKGLIRSK